jgi:hypothetical protein
MHVRDVYAGASDFGIDDGASSSSAASIEVRIYIYKALAHVTLGAHARNRPVDAHRGLRRSR